jgi:hypothetical protein
MIEPLPKGPGVQRAKAICDECSREEVFAAKFVKHHNSTCRKTGTRFTLDEQSVLQKAIGMRWALVKGKLHCPACEAKRKAAAQKEPEPMTQTEPPREPNRVQKREIMDMLGSVYDTKAERYIGGETDDTIAKELNVMPGWVAEIREEFFGPAGGNEDIDALASDLATFLAEAKPKLAEAEEAVKRVKAEIGRAEDMAEKLARIKAAVGPRKLKVAGV